MKKDLSNEELEVWKTLDEFGGKYQVSNLGRIKNKGFVRKDCPNRAGYRQIKFCHNYETKMYLVHRLVAHAFLPNPENKEHVHHINGVRDDNRACNLEWCDRSYNMQQVFKMGRTHKGGSHPRSKVTESDVRRIRELHDEGATKQEIFNLFGISKDHIGQILRRETWKHINSSDHISSNT